MNNDIILALLGDREAAARVTERDEPLPRPWCGGTVTAVSNALLPQMMCEECGAKGPRGYDRANARRAWNTRAPILSAEEMERLEADNASAGSV